MLAVAGVEDEGEVAEDGEAVAAAAEKPARVEAEEGVRARNLRSRDRNRSQPAARSLRGVAAAVAALRNPGRAAAEARVPSRRNDRAAVAEIAPLVRVEAAARDGRTSTAVEIVPPNGQTTGRVVQEETIVLAEIIGRAEVIVPEEITGQIVRVAAGTMTSLGSLAAAARRGPEAAVPAETIVPVGTIAQAKEVVFVPEAIIALAGITVHVPGTFLPIAPAADQAFCQVVPERAEVGNSGVPAAEVAIDSRIVPAEAAMERVGPINARAIVRSVRRGRSVRPNGRTSRTKATISGTSGSRRTTSTLTTSRQTA